MIFSGLRKSVTASIVAAAGVLCGCATVDEFALPPGDAGAGQEAFVSLGCNACHSADGVEVVRSSNTGLHVPLGGAVEYEKTYNELVTSVINPSHRISVGYGGREDDRTGATVSKMPVFNDVMTVRQLTDIVAYLAPQYRIVLVPFYYREYDYPNPY